MLLSNTRLLLLFAAFSGCVASACGYLQSNTNTGLSPIQGQKTEFPFPVKEPEVYQGNIMITSGGLEDRFFIARNGDKWRRDHFRDGVRAITELSSDGVYIIDHRKKVYAQEPALGNDVAKFDSSSVSFFRGKEYREFDEAGRESGLIKYQGRKGETSQDDILITIDEASGMIVRQEFASPGEESFVYELRDLKLEVDDALFQIPAGYRKVALQEIRSAIKQ